MSEQGRLRYQSPEKRRISLRSALGIGIGGLLFALLVSALGIEPQLFAKAEERAATRQRYHRLAMGSQRLLIALLNQQVGLRAYLATGDRVFLAPFDAGLRDEDTTAADIEADLSTADRGAVTSAWRALQRKSAAWRDLIVEPQKRERDAGPVVALAQKLLDGKRRFDELRVAQATFQRALDERSAAAIAAIDWQIDALHTFSLSAAAVMGVLGVLLTLFILKHTAAPLSALAQTAADGQPFQPPAAGTRIAEVHALSSALYELDLSARAREHLVQVAHERAVELGSFGEFVQQISDEGELHQVLARTLQQKAAPTRTNILARNASRNRLEIAWPSDAHPDEQYKHAILSDPIKCRAVRTLRPVSADAGAPTCCQCSLGVPAAGGSYLCVPMIAAGDLVGIVNMQADHAGGFAEDTQHATLGLIGFAATTLSSIRLLASARERALRDALTGAYNRAFLAEFLHKQISQAQRRSSSLALLMLDLDHFKRLNDTYGHPVGDAALVAFVGCLHKQLRDADAVVRYGGEEFVVVLPDTDLATALDVAERVRAAVASLTVSVGTEKHPGIITSSIGVASFPQHGHDEASLIASADRALYAAKLTGRNRVASADTSVSPSANPTA